MANSERTTRRIRLDQEVRRRQLVEVATALVLKQEFLPISMADLSQAAGVSKSLIYAYFPKQHDLFNAILAEQFSKLEAAGIESVLRHKNLEETVTGVADIYLQHVAQYGPIIHIIFRDQFMAGKLSSDVVRWRDRLVRRLACLGRRKLKLSVKEVITAFNLILTIPEEAGLLIFRGDLSVERGRELSRFMIASALKAMTPRTSSK